MRTFAIYGELVDTQDERSDFESVTPAQLRSFADNNLAQGEELQLLFNSPGGSVFAGIALANIVRKISADGHKVTGIVQGVAASAASIVLCACDEVVLSQSSLVMIHLPWTSLSGNAEDLRKEADTLDTILKAMLGFYRTKFDLTDKEITRLIENETWFSGSEADDFKFACTVIEDEDDFSIAAKVKDFDMTKFRNYKNMENKEEIKDEITTTTEETTTEETEVQAATVETVTGSDNQADETDEGKTVEEPETTDAVMVPQAEADKRVSGMQSTMQAKINSLVKDYESKINDFTKQLKTKDEELNSVKAELTSLTSKLEAKDSQISELSDRTSAVLDELDRKNDALQKLNGAVNTPKCSEESKPWKKLHGEALIQWCREHPNAR